MAPPAPPLEAALSWKVLLLMIDASLAFQSEWPTKPALKWMAPPYPLNPPALLLAKRLLITVNVTLPPSILKSAETAIAPPCPPLALSTARLEMKVLLLIVTVSADRKKV